MFTRPWKISMPIYRRLEPNAQLMEFRCPEMVEETVLGHLRKQQLVKRWQGKTMKIDVTRSVPPRRSRVRASRGRQSADAVTLAALRNVLAPVR